MSRRGWWGRLRPYARASCEMCGQFWSWSAVKEEWPNETEDPFSCDRCEFMVYPYQVPYAEKKWTVNV